MGTKYEVIGSSTKVNHNGMEFYVNGGRAEAEAYVSEVFETGNEVPPLDVPVYRMLNQSQYKITGAGYNMTGNGTEETAKGILAKLKSRLLETSKLNLKNEVIAWLDDFYEKKMISFGSLSQSTFKTQEAEFKAWSKDNTVSTPRVDQIATIRGIPRVTLLEKIGKNIEILYIGVGVQQFCEDKIESMETLEECLSYKRDLNLAELLKTKMLEVQSNGI